jgi:hypothetical protein
MKRTWIAGFCTIMLSAILMTDTIPGQMPLKRKLI